MEHVYSPTGQYGRVVSAHPQGGYLVEVAWEHGDEIHYAGVEHWPQTYPSAPTQKIDELILAKQAELAHLREHMGTLQRQNSAEQKSYTELSARIKKHSEALRYIDDYLEGRITHFVIGNGWYSNRSGTLAICDLTDPKGEAFYERDERRLLCLYGRKNLNLEWRLHAYSDGSGGSYTMAYPCLSLEAAQEKLKELTRLQIDQWSKDKNNADSSTTIIANCRTAGIEPPQEIVEFDQSVLLKNAQATVDEHTKKLANAEAVLNKLINSPVGA